MNFQYLIVLLIIIAAVAFVGRGVYRKARSFSPKGGCDTDCGCGGKSKKLSS